MKEGMYQVIIGMVEGFDRYFEGVLLNLDTGEYEENFHYIIKYIINEDIIPGEPLTEQQLDKLVEKLFAHQDIAIDGERKLVLCDRVYFDGLKYYLPIDCISRLIDDD